MKPHLHININGKKISSFHVFGAVGYFCGLALGIFLVWYTGLSILVILVMAGIGAGFLFGLTYLFKILTGQENIVYYHHEIGILVICWILLSFLQLPILPYIDIVLLGIGTFMAFGRWGCFSVGCCHGRPSKKGVVYSREHGEAGFPKYYVGVPIFPIPLIESVWVFFIVGTGIYFVISGIQPGSVIVMYTIIYGTARFFFEFFRGDAERPYFYGFSEAQWTTLLLVMISIAMSFIGWLPYYTWHPWAGVLLSVSMIGVYLYHKFQPTPIYQLALPSHIREIAMGLQRLDRYHANTSFKLDSVIPFVHTHMDMIVSKGQRLKAGAPLYHYTISSSNFNWILDYAAARKLANYFGAMRHQNLKYDIRKGRSGVFHLLFYPINKSPAINKHLSFS